MFNIVGEYTILRYSASQGSSRGDGVVSRISGGLCFDFPLGDITQYLAGTEDGIIHKCSVSYNDQVLDNYYGHVGAVYKVWGHSS